MGEKYGSHDTHELADAGKLRKTGELTGDPLTKAVAEARAIQFAQAHGISLDLAATIAGINKDKQKKK